LNQTSILPCNYAEALAGEIGKKYVEGKHGTPTKTMTDGLAVRTRRIDDELNRNTLTQICVFGAGLDTRPWRLKKPFLVDEPMHYFEVDFPEIFEFKLKILQEMGAASEFEYHSV
jgi:O-methyltransferase involved in polyketide biosynthesis